jgi:hypothetical protein
MNTKTKSNNVLTEVLREPLNGARRAQIDIDCGTGNLIVGTLPAAEPLLASGTLQYTEKQGPPKKALSFDHDLTHLTINGSGDIGKSWLRMPWSACNAATDWQIDLNRNVSLDIHAHSGGGNVRLDLTGATITRLSTDTGGGGIDLVLPDNLSDLQLNAKSGAGSVTIQMPGKVEAKIIASSGLGKVIIDPRFTKIAEKTYQSTGYETAVHKVEIQASTGAGSVMISCTE